MGTAKTKRIARHHNYIVQAMIGYGGTIWEDVQTVATLKEAKEVVDTLLAIHTDATEDRLRIVRGVSN